MTDYLNSLSLATLFRLLFAIQVRLALKGRLEYFDVKRIDKLVADAETHIDAA